MSFDGIRGDSYVENSSRVGNKEMNVISVFKKPVSERNLKEG